MKRSQSVSSYLSTQKQSANESIFGNNMYELEGERVQPQPDNESIFSRSRIVSRSRSLSPARQRVGNNMYELEDGRVQPQPDVDQNTMQRLNNMHKILNFSSSYLVNPANTIALAISECIRKAPISSGVIACTGGVSGISNIMNASKTRGLDRSIAVGDAVNSVATSISSLFSFGTSKLPSIASKTFGVGSAFTGVVTRSISAGRHFKNGERGSGYMSLLRILPQVSYGVGSFVPQATIVGAGLDTLMDVGKYIHGKYRDRQAARRIAPEII